MNGVRFPVSDLVGRPGKRRSARGTLDLDLMVGESRVEGPAQVDTVLEGIDEGVLARFVVGFPARLVCTRCLTGWEETLSVSAIQVFGEEPDEDGYGLAPDDSVDLSGPVRDEVALAVPLRPTCRPDCAGLCPTCGTDLNRDPCGGHDEPTSSPFDALRGLFDGEEPEQADSPQPDDSEPDDS